MKKKNKFDVNHFLTLSESIASRKDKQCLFYILHGQKKTIQEIADFASDTIEGFELYGSFHFRNDKSTTHNPLKYNKRLSMLVEKWAMCKEGFKYVKLGDFMTSEDCLELDITFQRNVLSLHLSAMYSFPRDLEKETMKEIGRIRKFVSMELVKETDEDKKHLMYKEAQKQILALNCAAIAAFHLAAKSPKFTVPFTANFTH